MDQILDIVFNKTPFENCHFTWIITNIRSADTLGPWKGPPILIDIEENQAHDEEPGDDNNHEIESTITFEEEKKNPEETTAAPAAT